MLGLQLVVTVIALSGATMAILAIIADRRPKD